MSVVYRDEETGADAYAVAEPWPPAPRLERDTFGILADAVRLAEVICDTELVPVSLRRRPDAVVAVVLAGHELGLGPMQSLQTIDLIQGRPSLSPEGMRALVLSRGHGLIIEAGDEAATVHCHRLEWPPDRWSSFTFTLEDAKRANLLGKDNWRQYPRAMLTARATAEACRAVWPDVIAGLSYTAEELESSAAPMPGPSMTGSGRRRGRRQPSEALDGSGPSQPAPPASPSPPTPSSTTTAPLEAVAELEGRLDRLSQSDRDAFKVWRRSKRWNWPPADAEQLEVMAAEVTVLEARAAEEQETYEPPIRRDSRPIGSPND